MARPTLPAALVPAAYDGREQALIKHTLLKSYLEKLFLIMGMAPKDRAEVELCYVDCFAGPWGDPSADLSATSIAISLETLQHCERTLRERGQRVKIRALYIEADREAHSRLKAYLETGTPPSVESACMHGDFVGLRTEILNWVGQRAFAFFFIDPKGFSQIGVGTLRPLLQRAHSEFLINLMYDHFNRVMSMADWQDVTAEILGARLDLAGLAPAERETLILTTYRNSLKTCIATRRQYPARAAHVRVMNPQSERPKYHLVYVTSHWRGVTEFMRISEQVDAIQAKVRVAKRGTRKSQATQMDELWAPGELIEQDLTRAPPELVDRYWRDFLAQGPRRIDGPAFADILELTGWFENDLQTSLVRLIQSGRIANRTANAARRYKRPLHYEKSPGETLEWTALAAPQTGQ
jgi:three-Cys-motif partner protein